MAPLIPVYQELAQAIRRLEATLVVTDIRLADQPDRGYERPFRWLKDYGIPKKYCRHYTTPDGISHITPRSSTGEADPTQQWMIELHPWLYNAIVRQGDILAVHPDYFRVTGGIERWLYRLARKAVPDKADPPAIRFKMETLHERSGVTRDLRRFAADIRKIAETQPLPEYGIQIEYRKGRRELVTLYRDTTKPCRPPRGRRLKMIRGKCIEEVINTHTLVQEPEPFVIPPKPGVPPESGLQRGREKAEAEELLQHMIEASEDGPNTYALPKLKLLRQQRIALTTAAFEIISPHLDASTRDKVRRLLEGVNLDF